MQTSFTPDYISATTKDLPRKVIIERFSFGLTPDEWISGKGHNGYEHALIHPFGHYIQWTNKRDDMGVNIQFTGRPLKEIHEGGYDTLGVINWLYEEGFKFARIDLAIDVHGIKFVLEDLQRCKFSGTVNKKPILYKNGPDAEEGSTLYIGSMQSEKFIRIYDKRAQTETQGDEWFRFELQTTKKTSQKIAKMIYNLSDTDAGRFAQGVMKAMFNPEHVDYQNVMAGDPIKVSSTKETSHKTYDWMMASIAPVMARLMLELPHKEVMKTFKQEVQKHINELAAKSLEKTSDLS
jgi:hypothetical protein